MDSHTLELEDLRPQQEDSDSDFDDTSRFVWVRSRISGKVAMQQGRTCVASARSVTNKFIWNKGD